MDNTVHQILDSRISAKKWIYGSPIRERGRRDVDVTQTAVASQIILACVPANHSGVGCGLTIDWHVALTCLLDITLVAGQKFLGEYLARILESQELGNPLGSVHLSSERSGKFYSNVKPP